MEFSVTLLGTSGGAPTAHRNCSATFVRTATTDVLIDCAENTQRQLLRAGFGMGRVTHILITHLHGDHYFGLAPLLSSLSMQGRTTPLAIISPPHLRPRLAPLLELDKYDLRFPLTFHEIIPNELVRSSDIGELELSVFPLRHRIATNGYLLREKERQPNIDKEALAKYDIPWPEIRKIKAGGDFMLPDGTVVPNADLLTPAPPPRAYAHCSDTTYFPELAGYVRGVDLLYHEATFLADMAEDAETKGHATAAAAARTARDGGVGQLILAHYSTRYESSHAHEAEARGVFPNTFAADDLQTFHVPFQRRQQGARTQVQEKL